jgi:O-antigen ligase
MAGFRLDWPTRAALRQACCLTNLCRFFALLLVAWQPFPGEYRIPLVASALLGLLVSFRGELSAIAEPAKRLGLLLLCLVIPGLLSIPTSLAPSKSWGEIASVLLAGLAGISVLYGLRDKASHRWLQRWLACVIAIWIGDGLIQAIWGTDLLGVPLRNGMVTGPFTPLILLGIITVIVTPLALWEPIRTRKAWGIPLLLGIVVIVILTGQRNNLLLLGVAIAPLFWMWSRKTGLILLASAIALSMIAYQFSPALQSRINTTQSFISSALNADPSPEAETKSESAERFKQRFDALNQVTSDRWFIFDTAARMIKDRPLTGVGINAFRPAYKTYAQTTDEQFRDNPPHAHNTYLEITAETGFIGLAGLLIAIGLGYRWFRNATQERQELAAPYASSLIVMLFPFSTHHVLLAAFYFSIFLLVIGGFLSALFSPLAIVQGDDNTVTQS